MSSDGSPDRVIVKAPAIGFEPYLRYGKRLEGIDWIPIRFDSETGQGSFLIRFQPGTKSLPHIHGHGEELVILDGELIDTDGTVLEPGDVVSFAPGSHHQTRSEVGCVMHVYLRGPNTPVEDTAN